MEVLNLRNPFVGAEIFYKDITDSTMNDARKLLVNNPESGTVVVAGEQLSGRGRVAGRKWLGGKDESLMFTLMIREEDVPFFKTLFPLYAGFCIMNCLEKYYGTECRVKWPNDVLVDGRKISGILCENTDRYILCGCGINLNQKESPGFDKLSEKSLGRSPVSLYQLKNKETDSNDFLIKLLDMVKNNLGTVTWKDSLKKKLYRAGENIVLHEGIPGKSERIEGIVKGLGDYGQLIISEKETGAFREVYSGEII